MAKKPVSSEKPVKPGAAAKAAKAPAKPAKKVIERERKPAGIPAPRPMLLRDVIGQERALSTLRDAVKSGRLAHAWVFHGPQGVGKFTTALAFASAALDPTARPGSSGDLEPAPDSPTQRLIAAGTHPDLQIISKELAKFSTLNPDLRDAKQTNIPIDVIREFLVEHAQRAQSASGGGALATRVYIIDEAELIDERGTGPLLKTLEEPAPGRLMILVTSNEQRLPITIRSRCQRLAFAPLDDEAMSQWYKRSGVLAGVAEAEQRDWLKAFAGGSPGAAMLAVETGLHTWHSRLAPLLAQARSGAYPLDLGPAMAALVDDWAKAWVGKDANRSKDAANRAGARHLFGLLAEDYRRRLREPAARAGALAALDGISEAEQNLGANVQLALVMDSLAARLAG